MQSGDISATFNFSTPAGASGNTDSGTISATVVQGEQHISIMWSDPITILFSNGDELQVDLGNVNHDCDGSCNGDNFDISGTFTELNPSATPLPATLPLFAGGLGFVGFLAKRRKNAKQALAA